jgi:Na+-driven multidrug efflux pump
MIGANGAQETLSSQAFGMGDLKLCGQYLNRGRAVITVIFIPSALFLAFFAETILLKIGQDPSTASNA